MGEERKGRIDALYFQKRRPNKSKVLANFNCSIKIREILDVSENLTYITNDNYFSLGYRVVSKMIFLRFCRCLEMQVSFRKHNFMYIS